MREGVAPSDGGFVSQALSLVAAGIAGTVIAYAAMRFLHAHVGHDQAWGLYAAAAVLRGVPLNGSELVEVNPPFLLWFMSVPVLLAHGLGLGLLNGFRVFFLGLACSTGAWSISLFRRFPAPRPALFWMFVLLLGAAGGRNVLLDDLGQREHIVVFLLLPYLLVAAFRMEARPVSLGESLAAGVAAAVGICLKPQHLLDVAFVEALLLFQPRGFKRWLHPALGAFSVGLVAYFVMVRALVPNYFTDIVPLLQSTYWGFNTPMREVLYGQRRSILGLVLGSLIFFALRTRLRLRTLEAVLLAAGVGALGAYVQQHKAWSYQMICVEFLTILFLGIMGSDLLDRALVEFGPARRWGLPSALPVGVAVAAFTLMGVWSAIRGPRSGYQEPQKDDLSAIYAEYPRGTVVDFLSPSPWEFPAVVEQDKVWGSRYLHQWLLPAILRSQNPQDEAARGHMSAAEADRLSALLRSNTVADLAHWRPAVVVVGPCNLDIICQGLAAQHLRTMLDWFLLDSGFRDEWGHYAFEKTVDDLDVYKRKP